MLQSLIHIFLRFGQFHNTVFTDIEGMFLQVGVFLKDKASIRFLRLGDSSIEVAVSKGQRYLWFEGVFHLRKLGIEENRTRPRCRQVSKSRPERAHEFLLGRLTRVDSNPWKKAKDLVKIFN